MWGTQYGKSMSTSEFIKAMCSLSLFKMTVIDNTFTNTTDRRVVSGILMTDI